MRALYETNLSECISVDEFKECVSIINRTSRKDVKEENDYRDECQWNATSLTAKAGVYTVECLQVA